MKAAFRVFNVIIFSSASDIFEGELVFRCVVSKMFAILPQINEITYFCTWYDIVEEWVWEFRHLPKRSIGIGFQVFLHFFSGFVDLWRKPGGCDVSGPRYSWSFPYIHLDAKQMWEKPKVWLNFRGKQKKQGPHTMMFQRKKSDVKLVLSTP